MMRVMYALISMDMDCMMGSDYTRALDKMEWLVDVNAKKYTIENNGCLEEKGYPYLAIPFQCELDKIESVMDKGFGTLQKYFNDTGIEPTGTPIAIYTKMNMLRKTIAGKLAIPCPPNSQGKGIIQEGQILPSLIYKTTLTGSYANLGIAWSKAQMRCRANGFKQNRKLSPWEVYITDPGTTPPDENITEICIPIK